MTYLIDTHCHLSHFPKKDQKAVIERARQANVEKLITVTCNLQQIEETLPIAQAHDFIWMTAGIHPTDLMGDIKENVRQLYQYAKKEPKIVAIGEIGLDYYHDNFPHELQARYFTELIAVARELNKPVIIHCRGGKNPGENEKAFLDLVRILERERLTNAVVHCFSGNTTEAEKIIDLGLMVSFTGIITYKKNDALREVVAALPLDRIMLETDSPYIAVEGKRGTPGEPADVVTIAQTIATVKAIPVEEVIQMTTENAERFFRL